MLMITKAYVCEHGVRRQDRAMVTAAWDRVFGKASKAAIGGVVTAIARRDMDGWVARTFIGRVLRDLPDEKMRRAYSRADTNLCGPMPLFRALDRRTVREIEDTWEGSLDYC